MAKNEAREVTITRISRTEIRESTGMITARVEGGVKAARKWDYYILPHAVIGLSE
jgi:hypothetical protein